MKRFTLPAVLAFVFLSCAPAAKVTETSQNELRETTRNVAQETAGDAAPAVSAKTSSYVNPMANTGLSLFPEPQALPDISFVALDGKVVSLSDYRGKVILLNFWATWCPPCKAEMPSIQRLSDKLAGTDFTVLAISVSETRSTVETFLVNNPYTFPIFLDESGQTSAGFVGRGIPTTYVVDKEGRAIAGIIGSKEWDEAPVLAALSTLAAK